MVKSICSSGFSGSKLACIELDATSILSLSLSPLLGGFPFGFPPHGCRISIRIAAFQRSTLRRFEHELFLLEHLAVIKRFRRRGAEKRGKTKSRPFETFLSLSLDDDKKRIRKRRVSRAYARLLDRITSRSLYYLRGEEDWFLPGRARISLEETGKLGLPC